MQLCVNINEPTRPHLLLTSAVGGVQGLDRPSYHDS
jgi:hypothetical protein